MEKINSMGRNLAMDGHLPLDSKKASLKVYSPKTFADAKKVVQDLTKNNAQEKIDAEQMRKVSDSVTGQKIRFSVNQELGEIVVAIVDPQTNQVIKEIPTVEQQKIRMKLKKTTGLIFDRIV